MKIVITSGYFNPLHGGHLDLIEASAKLGDKLVVIVGNDTQQHFKKGKIILDQDNRMRLIKALRYVDEAVLAVDTEDTTIPHTLELVGQKYAGNEIIFAKGGDRSSIDAMPQSEVEICKKYNIKIIFGVGGTHKADSSTRINQATNHE